MDTENAVVQMCVEGSLAEFEGRLDDARGLYLRAWESAKNDYEACVAAHYMARRQPKPEDALRWNLIALARADATSDARCRDFYPSLYLNLGESHERMGNAAEASRYYDLAARLGFEHQP